MANNNLKDLKIKVSFDTQSFNKSIRDLKNTLNRIGKDLNLTINTKINTNNLIQIKNNLKNQLSNIDVNVNTNLNNNNNNKSTSTNTTTNTNTLGNIASLVSASGSLEAAGGMKEASSGIQSAGNNLKNGANEVSNSAKYIKESSNNLITGGKEISKSSIDIKNSIDGFKIVIGQLENVLESLSNIMKNTNSLSSELNKLQELQVLRSYTKDALNYSKKIEDIIKGLQDGTLNRGSADLESEVRNIQDISDNIIENFSRFGEFKFFDSSELKNLILDLKSLNDDLKSERIATNPFGNNNANIEKRQSTLNNDYGISDDVINKTKELANAIDTNSERFNMLTNQAKEAANSINSMSLDDIFSSDENLNKFINDLKELGIGLKDIEHINPEINLEYRDIIEASDRIKILGTSWGETDTFIRQVINDLESNAKDFKNSMNDINVNDLNRNIGLLPPTMNRVKEEAALLEQAMKMDGSEENGMAILIALQNIEDAYKGTLSSINSEDLGKILKDKFKIEGIEDITDGFGNNFRDMFDNVESDMVSFRLTTDNTIEDIANTTNLNSKIISLGIRQAFAPLNQLRTEMEASKQAVNEMSSSTENIDDVLNSSSSSFDDIQKEINKFRESLNNNTDKNFIDDIIKKLDELFKKFKGNENINPDYVSPFNGLKNVLDSSKEKFNEFLNSIKKGNEIKNPDYVGPFDALKKALNDLSNGNVDFPFKTISKSIQYCKDSYKKFKEELDKNQDINIDTSMLKLTQDKIEQITNKLKDINNKGIKNVVKESAVNGLKRLRDTIRDKAINSFVNLEAKVRECDKKLGSFFKGKSAKDIIKQSTIKGFEKLKSLATKLPGPLKKVFNIKGGSTEESLDKLNKKGEKVQSTFKKLASVLGPILGISAAFNFVKESISESMDAIETDSLYNTVFESTGAVKELNSWIGNLNSTLGISETELKKYSATFYNMGNSMGLSKDTAIDMSKNLSQLAYDMSSFYNISPEEAFTKLKGVYTGESDALKSIGVVITENQLKQYGYNSSMSEAEKIMIRYKAVCDQTATAQGDMARTLNLGRISVMI